MAVEITYKRRKVSNNLPKMEEKNIDISDADRDVVERLRQACQKLVYYSEIDAPIEPFVADATDIDMSQTVGRLTNNAPLEEIGFDEFFRPLVSQPPRLSSEQIERALFYADLKGILESEVRDLTVFRAGQTRLAIFVIGFSKDGRLMGIRTKAVET